VAPTRIHGLFCRIQPPSRAQVTPTASGIPWLGFVVYPDYRLVKARKVRYATHRLGERYAAYRAGLMPFTEFDAGVRGWIAHVRHADSWGLRRHLLAPLLLKAGDVPGGGGGGA